MAQRERGMAQYSHPKYAPECACLNGHSISVTAWNYSASVFKRYGLLIAFFIKSFIYDKVRIHICIFRLVIRYLSVARKKNLPGVSTGLTGGSKNLDLTGNPTGGLTRPVSTSAVEALHCVPFYCWTSNRENVNINFSSFWFNPTESGTKLYRFSCKSWFTQPLTSI